MQFKNIIVALATVAISGQAIAAPAAVADANALAAPEAEAQPEALEVDLTERDLEARQWNNFNLQWAAPGRFHGFNFPNGRFRYNNWWFPAGAHRFQNRWVGFNNNPLCQVNQWQLWHVC